MRHKYRLLQLRPDLRRDDVLTIGAFLQIDNQVRFVEAPTLPGPECLGSTKAHQHLSYIRESIERMGPDEWWSEIPSVVGRAVRMGATQELCTEHPLAWLKNEILPNYRSERSRSSSQTRATLGKQFFENEGVGQYVRARFQMDTRYHLVGLEFPNFSLVTLGEADTLLIEPLKFGHVSFNQNVREIARKFQAAKYAEQRKPNSFARKPFKIATLLLPGITDEGRLLAEEFVSGSTDYLFDARDTNDRIMARNLVEEIGHTYKPPEIFG